MKKLLLTLGTITTVVVPVASVVACGDNSTDELTSVKEKMIKSLDGTTYTLTATEKADFIKRINGVKDSDGFKAITTDLMKYMETGTATDTKTGTATDTKTGTATDTKTGTATDTKTALEIARDAIKTAKANIDLLNNTATTLGTVLASSLSSAISPTTIGFVAPNAVKDVVYKYAVKNTDDVKGTLSVEVTITYGTESPIVKDFTLTGFKQSNVGSPLEIAKADAIKQIDNAVAEFDKLVATDTKFADQGKQADATFAIISAQINKQTDLNGVKNILTLSLHQIEQYTNGIKAASA